MKKMTMEKAVEYCKNKHIAIHVPTYEAYSKVKEYLERSAFVWGIDNYFSNYENNTCINLEEGRVMFCNVSWYKDHGYEVIDIIDEPAKDEPLTITIKSDGHKVVSASCNNITTTAKCNDTDTFNLSKGSHMALKRLIDKMNEPKFGIGDIVEIIGNSYGADKSSVGLQGIIIPGGELIRVKFPIDFGASITDWYYAESDLKLIRKAQ